MTQLLYFVFGEALLSKQVKVVIHFNKFTFDPISLEKLEQGVEKSNLKVYIGIIQVDCTRSGIVGCMWS